MNATAHNLTHNLMLAHQFLYYVKHAPVISDREYDLFCKANGLDGGGGSDLEESYPRHVVALANAMAKPERNN